MGASLRGEVEPPVLLGTEPDEAVTLPTYTVEAWNFERDVFDLPAQAVVIPAEVLQRYGSASLPEVLRSEANVTFTSTSGRSDDAELSLGGFGENSGLRVLVLVDGVRFNRADLGTLDWQALPLGQIERVEVLRGGQSVLYGDQALAAVIRITTRRQEAPPGVSGQAQVGSYGSRAVSLTGRAVLPGQQTGPKAAGSDSGPSPRGSSPTKIPFFGYVSATVDGREEEGFRENAASWSRGVAVQAGGGLDAGRWDAGLSYRDADRSFPGPLTEAQFRDDPRQSSNSGEERTAESSTRSHLRWATPNAFGALEAVAALSLRDARWSLDGIDADNRQYGLSVNPRQQVETPWGRVQGGLDVNYAAIEFTQYLASGILPDDRYRYASETAFTKRWTVAPYGLAEWEATETLTVALGGRVEAALSDADYRPAIADQVYPFRLINRPPFTLPNPSFRPEPEVDAARAFQEELHQLGWSAEGSLLWRPQPLASFWLRAARLYRYPTLDETAAFQGFPLADPFNQDLAPEVGWLAEVGSRWERGPLRASGAVFAQWLEGEITFDPVARLNRNLADTRRLGANAMAQADWGTWGLTAAIDAVDARLTSGPDAGKEVPLAPWLTGTGAVWVRPWVNTRLALQTNYLPRRFPGGDTANREPPLDDHWLFAFRAEVGLGTHARLTAIADNLLNTSYASTAFNGNYYPARGRYLELGLTWTLP